ncbi:hypothetical protein HHUSO_G19989 [Huso huso]|uniref:Uncharacterized protein n=1 Tax=Huso huso TaxID=61971 RepID=A0ABR0Z3T2_HUSHU
MTGVVMCVRARESETATLITASFSACSGKKNKNNNYKSNVDHRPTGDSPALPDGQSAPAAVYCTEWAVKAADGTDRRNTRSVERRKNNREASC